MEKLVSCRGKKGGEHFNRACCALFNNVQILIVMNEERISINSPKGRLVEIDGVRYQVVGGKLFRYVDLTMDKAFKIVLGRVGSEEILMHLLNSILGTSIIRLEYRNTEHPGMTEDERSSRFDVYCEAEDGTCFEVEMQNWSQKFFHKRAVYYSSLVVQNQAAKARRVICEDNRDMVRRWNYDFRPLYVISFLNFKNWTSENIGMKRSEYISLYRYKDVETGNELNDGTNLVFVNLHGFKKKIEDCETPEDIWMYCLKNMFALNSCPDKFKGTRIEDLFVLSEFANMPTELRIKIEEELMTQNDILNSIAEQVEDGIAEGIAQRLAERRAEVLAEGRAEGLVEGRAEGLAEGRAEGRAEGERFKMIEIARRLLDDGMPVDKVVSITGVSLDDLRD